ncbi:hypothetical protein EDB83DRAFT_2363175, partial [Lactarius deliciosus]
MRLSRTTPLPTRAKCHNRSLNSRVRSGYPVCSQISSRSKLNVELPRHTPPTLQILFVRSLAPLCNHLFYTVADRCSMAHGSHDPCAWTRLAPEPIIPSLPPHSTFAEIGNIVLMVVLLPPMTSQSTCCSFSRIFASPVCGVAWRKGQMRAMMLSGTKVRFTIWLNGSTASWPSISMRPLHTLAPAVHFAARSSPSTGEHRPCHCASSHN